MFSVFIHTQSIMLQIATDTYTRNVTDSREKHIKGDFLQLSYLCCVAYKVYGHVAVIELHLCIENSKKIEFFWVF